MSDRPTPARLNEIDEELRSGTIHRNGVSGALRAARDLREEGRALKVERNISRRTGDEQAAILRRQDDELATLRAAVIRLERELGEAQQRRDQLLRDVHALEDREASLRASVAQQAERLAEVEGQAGAMKAALEYTQDVLPDPHACLCSCRGTCLRCRIHEALSPSTVKAMVERVAKLERVARLVETVVPYVTTTLRPGNCMRLPGKPDWIGVHFGRASSSHNQLAALEREAKAALFTSETQQNKEDSNE